jgi:hypothetical protein
MNSRLLMGSPSCEDQTLPHGPKAVLCITAFWPTQLPFRVKTRTAVFRPNVSFPRLRTFSCSHPGGRLSCIGRLGNHLGRFHNPRQPDREGRAAAGLALDRDVAAHPLSEASADGEPKPRAAVFASRGCIGLGEFVEQPAYLLRRHADTSVADRDGHPVAGTFLPLSCVDGDGAVVGELVGVAHEVQQRLPQSHLDRGVTMEHNLIGVLYH